MLIHAAQLKSSAPQECIKGKVNQDTGVQVCQGNILHRLGRWQRG